MTFCKQDMSEIALEVLRKPFDFMKLTIVDVPISLTHPLHFHHYNQGIYLDEDLIASFVLCLLHSSTRT